MKLVELVEKFLLSCLFVRKKDSFHLLDLARMNILQFLEEGNPYLYLRKEPVGDRDFVLVWAVPPAGDRSLSLCYRFAHWDRVDCSPPTPPHT